LRDRQRHDAILHLRWSGPPEGTLIGHPRNEPLSISSNTGRIRRPTHARPGSFHSAVLARRRIGHDSR
jgi:hypothetical protein